MVWSKDSVQKKTITFYKFLLKTYKLLNSIVFRGVLGFWGFGVLEYAESNGDILINVRFKMAVWQGPGADIQEAIPALRQRCDEICDKEASVADFMTLQKCSPCVSDQNAVLFNNAV